MSDDRVEPFYKKAIARSKLRNQRAVLAYNLRMSGMTYREVGDRIPRFDRRSGPLSSECARQIVEWLKRKRKWRKTEDRIPPAWYYTCDDCGSRFHPDDPGSTTSCVCSSNNIRWFLVGGWE